jgi:cadmium resistance protein CadD (predicted permease)
MLLLLAAATAAFVATNLDGLVLLTVLFATPKMRWQTVVAGQYLGLASLVAISAVAAAGLVVVPKRWVGLAGVIPLALGVRALLQQDGTPPTTTPPNLAGVVGLIVANGADNVAVYTPVFRHLGPGASLFYALIFAVLSAALCVIAAWLARRRLIAQTVARWSHVIIPVVFIVIGAALLATTL